MLAFGVVLTSPALADDASDYPFGACDRAASRAEADWHLPAGLLAAIGTIESGRSGLGSRRPVAWPWGINAGGRSLYQPSKDAAIMTVRALRAIGLQAIDVGCFQIDLFYHPGAFITLDAAFDPDANAQAAARILTSLRLNGGSWEAAIALYHSASAIRGAQYLQQVRAVWTQARARSAVPGDDEAAAYAVLLSPAALLVRVITTTGPAGPALKETVGLPRVVGPQDSSAVLQWAAASQQGLPVILTPGSSAPPRVPGRGILK
jgi:hypothetical protein